MTLHLAKSPVPGEIVISLFRCFALFLVLFACGSALTAAEPALRNFDIPVGNAEQTLKTYSVQSGQEVLFATSTAGRVRTNAVKGEYTPDQALGRLLKDTGLVSNRDSSSGTISVTRDPNGQRAAQKNSDRPNASEDRSEKLVELPTFEVMGSKSLNMDLRRTRDDAQPYVTFNRDTLTRSGAITIEDFLKDRLTMNTQAGTAGQSFSGGTGTASYINLRGLGAAQTLILIDGRRAPTRFDATGGIAQPDLNGIPLAAVERIEVLPTTASGIYGGSALGGVINVILRRDYAGVELKTTYENAFDTDVASKRVDFSAGFTLEGGKTNVMFALSYADSNVMLMRDRDFMRDYRLRVVANNGGNQDILLRGTTPPQGSTPNIRSSTGVNLTLKNGTALNSSRTFVPVGYGGVLTDAGAALVANAGKFNLDLGAGSGGGAGGMGVFNTPGLRSGALTVRRQFSSRLEAYLDGSYSTNTSRSPFGATEGFYTLPASAANNPFNEPIIVSVPFPNPDLVMFNRTTNAKLAGGLVVGLPHDWKGNLDYAWGQSYGNYRVSTAVPTALTTAVLAGSVDVLRDTTRFPLAVASFGPYFFQEDLGAPRLTSRIATLRVAGPTWQLPAGPVNLAGLVEYHKQRTSDGALALSEAIPVFLIPNRSQAVYSGYAEAKIPLFAPAQRVRWLQSLELQLAVRHDSYTTNGTVSVSNPTATTVIPRATNRVNSTDPTVALRWLPITGVMVRGSYGTGFFPPNMNSLIRRISTSGTNVTDPRRGNTLTLVPTGQVASGGNPDLKPEQSESWSAGVVFTPPQLSGLRFSVDYSRIEKADNFASLLPQVVVDTETYLPNRVIRGANLPGDPAGWAGPITFLDVSTVNLSMALIEAYDAQLDYTLKTQDWGTFDFTMAATKLARLNTQVTPLAPVVRNVGFGAIAAASDITSPLELKANAGISWTRGRWTANWFARYYDSYRVYAATANAATAATQTTNQGNGGFVESQVFHDLSATYRFGGGGEKDSGWRHAVLSDLELSLGVKNIFNTKPAFNATAVSLGFYSLYADPRMASYWVTLKKSW